MRQTKRGKMFDHPATIFTCRHCGQPAGYDPEMCFYCGPICPECFTRPGKCKGQLKAEKEFAEKNRQEKKK